jgi:preprotein translocase subunit SecA
MKFCAVQKKRPSGRHRASAQFPFPDPLKYSFDDSLDGEDSNDDDADDAARPAVGDWKAPARVAPLKAGPKVGRNEPCPCGSGKKYKRCWMP